MITKSKSFTTSDNQIFGTIELAQQHELEVFLTTSKEFASKFPENVVMDNLAKAVASAIIAAKDEIVNLLTLKSTSRPAARKPKKKKSAATTETPPA